MDNPSKGEVAVTMALLCAPAWMAAIFSAVIACDWRTGVLAFNGLLLPPLAALWMLCALWALHVWKDIHHA